MFKCSLAHTHTHTHTKESLNRLCQSDGLRCMVGERERERERETDRQTDRQSWLREMNICCTKARDKQKERFYFEMGKPQNLGFVFGSRSLMFGYFLNGIGSMFQWWSSVTD